MRFFLLFRMCTCVSMNFFQQAINSEQLAPPTTTTSSYMPVSSYIESYMKSLRPDELRQFVANYLPQKLNEELKTTPANDYTTRPPIVNLLNVCALPVIIMGIVLNIQKINMLWKMCIVIMVIIHIVMSTTFVVSIEQRKMNAVRPETTMTTTTVVAS